MELQNAGYDPQRSRRLIKEFYMSKSRKLTAAVLAACMVFVCAFSSFADTVYVNVSTSLNYRNAPSMSGTVLGTFSNGTKLERISDDGEWSKVETGSGSTVYVSSRYLTTAAPSSASSSSGTAVSQTASDSPYVSSSWSVPLNSAYKYASNSKINSGSAVYYQNGGSNRNGKVVCVNAGHGTSGGESVKTLCHPDGTAKVTGGSTAAGSTTASAVSSGTTFLDGTSEASVTLKLAQILRDKLLAAGYDVLMIRESSDVQLDNVARTVIANNNADIHIALHWDSTTTDKGAYYCSVPNVSSYRSMEPVASHWQDHHALGNALISGLKSAGVSIWSGNPLDTDLTQTSYSTIPSVDIELGDRASSHSDATLNTLADGLLAGINTYFGF